MTFDEAQAQYIAALRDILSNDPALSAFITERDVLVAQDSPENGAQIASLNNRIRNTVSSDESRKAIKALRDLRLGA
jgi:hypothetical protein